MVLKQFSLRILVAFSYFRNVYEKEVFDCFPYVLFGIPAGISETDSFRFVAKWFLTVRVFN